MKKLKLEIESEISIMENYKLTAEEWFFLQLIFLAQEEEGHPELLQQYLQNNVEKTPIRELLISIQNKGIINKSYKIPEKGKSFDPDRIEFNKVFINTVIKNSGEMGLELYQAYPKTIIISGTNYILTNITKKFNSFNDFCYAYGKSIRFKPERHAEVMELLEWGKENNILNFGVCEFVIGMKWEYLRELRDKGDINGYINSTIEML